MSRKNYGMLAAAYLVILVAYHLAIYLLFKTHTQVFWISYGFMIAAYLIHIACMYSIVKNISVKTVFFGIPLFSFSLYFVCAELFCSFVFMLFQTKASNKIAVAVQGILLCIFIVIGLISIMARDTVRHVDTKIREHVNFIKAIMADVEILMERSTEPDVTLDLKNLVETIKYSDPMSNSHVAEQEKLIMQELAELNSCFNNSDIDNVKAHCNKMNLLLIERNKKIMISK